MNTRSIFLITGLIMAVGVFLFSIQSADAFSENPLVQAPTNERIFLPIIVKQPTSTPTMTPTPTQTPTPTLTPSPTPTTFTGVAFVGTTNQGKPVTIHTNTDVSAWTRFEIEVDVSCPGVTAEKRMVTTSPSGSPIENRRIEIRVRNGFGQDDIFSGRFNSDRDEVDGTWEAWVVIGTRPICSNTGTWGATKQ